MTLHRRLLVLLALLTLAGESKAQIIYQVYNPYPVGISYGGGGIGFGFRKRHFFAGGFFGNSYLAAGPIGYSPFLPFGVADRSVTIQIFNPPNIVVSPRLQSMGGRKDDDDDLSGIDLDLVPSKKEAPARIAPPADDLPKKPKAEEKPPPEPPKKLQPPPPPPGPKEPGPLPPPKKDRVEETQRLITIGQDAFHQQLYGVAAQRFNQAVALLPAQANAHFLLSQSQFALGKYRDAVAEIYAGMKLDAGWPKANFNPRAELYKNHKDFADHLNRLEDVAAMNADDPDLLFLLAHQMWFDGQRNRAVTLLRQARILAADPTYIDMFLRAAGPGPLAAK
jgi:hypothetical protein